MDPRGSSELTVESNYVIPAKAGIHPDRQKCHEKTLKFRTMDSCLRRNDVFGTLITNTDLESQTSNSETLISKLFLRQAQDPECNRGTSLISHL